MAKHVLRPSKANCPLENSAVFALELVHELDADVIQWRRQILAEIKQLIEDPQEEVSEWWRGIPVHCRSAYTSHVSPLGCVALPIFEKLGTIMGYPKISELVQEASRGFRLLGRVMPGVGWRKRPLIKPGDPLSVYDLPRYNAEVMRETATEKPDKHADILLDEILKERSAGRMTGPFQAPVEWGITTVPLPDVMAQDEDKRCSLRQIPPDQVPCGAPAFSISQYDAHGSLLKIRRGDDWRRSLHNSTGVVEDRPSVHGVDYFIDGARASRKKSSANLLLWGHDQEGAYRQFAVDNPFWCMCLLLTTFGPTLWAHNVMPFGAVGAVWGYGRIADFVTQMARCLLLALCWHCVDDLGSVEREESAMSAFESFEQLKKYYGCS